MVRMFVAAGMVALAVTQASGGELARYNFSDTGWFANSSQVSSYAAGVNPSAVTMTGLSPTLGSAAGLWSKDVIYDRDPSAYFQWSITPDANRKISIDYVDIAYAPQDWSCDEYTLYINGLNYGTRRNAYGYVNVGRIQVGILNTSEPVTFQLMPFGDWSGGGVFGLTSDLVINGNVTVVPEPGLVGVGALLVPLLGRRRRS